MLKNALQKIFGTSNELDVLSLIPLEKHASRSIQLSISKKLKNYKITPSEWVILSTISKHNQGINPLNISLVLGLKPSFITNSLKKFEKMRLIFLAENVIKDKRFKSYTISPKGLGILNESQVAVEEGLIELFEGVSPKDLEGFNTVLKHLSLRGEKTIASS